jgi:hypothetical protein
MNENTFSSRDCFDPEPSLRKFQNDPTPENELQFLTGLKNAKFLVPCRAKRKGTGNGYCMAVLSMQTEEKFLPAFSSHDELKKWPYENDRTALCSYDKLKHAVLDDPENLSGIAVNPFGRVLLLRQEQLRHIDSKVEGMYMHRVDHRGNLRLSRPGCELPGLAEALKNLLRSKDEIYRAYLLLAQEPGDAEPHWLFIIDFNGEKDVLFPAVARVVRPYMRPGESFEIMKATYILLQHASAMCGPIYRKEQAVDGTRQTPSKK